MQIKCFVISKSHGILLDKTKIYNCHYYCYPYLVLLLCLDFMDSLGAQETSSGRTLGARVFIQSRNSIPRGPETLKLIFCGEGASLFPVSSCPPIISQLTALCAIKPPDMDTLKESDAKQVAQPNR